MSGHRFLRLSIVVAALVAAAMASAGTTTYTFNALDQVTAVSGPGGSASYSYDGDGQRIKRTAGGQTVVYLRDPSGEVIAEYSSSGTLLAEYVYVDGKRLCKITKDAEGVERRIYYHTDVVGTPVALTSETGTVTATAQNRPFGEQVGAPLPDSHAFTGKELDPETGLNYFGARYYDAHLGRFISVDPVGGSNEDPQSWNRYAYARNNPLRFIDPTGLVLEEVTVRVGGQDHTVLVDSTVAQGFRDLMTAVQAANIPVTLNYAFRTTAEQQELYDQRDQNPNPVAAPGTSRHEAGFAIDLGGVGRLPEPQRQQLNTLAGQNGFSPLAGDTPHFDADPSQHGYASRQAAIQTNQQDYQNRFSPQGQQTGAPRPAAAAPATPTPPAQEDHSNEP